MRIAYIETYYHRLIYLSGVEIMRRYTIEQFCREFSQGEQCELRTIIRNNRQMFSRIEVPILAEENFDSVIRRVSAELFSIRPAHKSYVIALLEFALKVDHQHQEHSWYKQDRLIDILVDVLEKVEFNPKTTNYILLYIVYYC